MLQALLRRRCRWCGAVLSLERRGRPLARHVRYCNRECSLAMQLYDRSREDVHLSPMVTGERPPDLEERLARFEERAAAGLPLFGERT